LFRPRVVNRDRVVLVMDRAGPMLALNLNAFLSLASTCFTGSEMRVGCVCWMGYGPESRSLHECDIK